MILRVFIIFAVLISTIFWPEKSTAIAVLMGCVIAIIVVIMSNTEFCRIFLQSFIASSIIAYMVYAATAPIGDFAAPSQTSGAASDSQFFLYEARRFINEGNIDALFSTWGSFIPVIFGSGALIVFSGNFIGIVFFNSILYSLSVLYTSRIFNVSNRSSRFLPFFGWMPLQAFYNSMLSKESIYLFLIIFPVYIFKKNYDAGHISRFNWFVFICSIVVCMLLRPIAAMVVVLVCIAYLFAKSPILRFIYLIVTLLVIFFAIISIANFLGYEFPINISYDALIVQRDFMEMAAGEKALGSNLTWLFTPPWSILLSPILGSLWMVSPLPLLGNLVSQLDLMFSGSFTFKLLATVNRYMDAALMVMLLIVGLVRRRRLKTVIINPLTFIAVILVFATVMFQFLESGRHRYFPGFILAMVILASIYPPKQRW